MLRTTCAVMFSLVLLAGATTRGASVALTITDATIRPGGTATVDVLISSADAAVLDIFGIVVQIDPAATGLGFVNPPLDTQLTDPSYLFFGDSAAALAPPAGTIVSRRYIGGDGTLSGSGVLVPETPTLLARLALTTATPNPPVGGERFTVSVVADDPNTFFLDPSFNSIDLSGTSPGTVSVVPEPATLPLVAIGLGLAWSARRRHRRRPASP